MKVKAIHRRTAIPAGLAAIAMAFGLTTAPASAMSSGKADYVALGDSYAAGQGALPYEDLSCFVSKRGYPLLADALRTAKLKENAACSGHDIAGVIRGLPKKLKHTTDIVTVTVGANDLNAVGVLTECLPDPEAPTCIAAKASAEAKIADGSLEASLQDLITRIRTAAPEAKIVLTGYPRLFDPSFPLPFGAKANELADSLNFVIMTVANTDGDNRTRFVDVSTAFAGHGIGSMNPWINFNPVDPGDSANFHPTADGYQHGYYASLVMAGVFN